MALYRKRKLGFTVTELITALILLTFVGSVVAVRTTELSKQKGEIEKIKATYEMLEDATVSWQFENKCKNDIKVCIMREKNTTQSRYMFNGIAKYLPVVASTVDVNVNGKSIIGENLSSVNWLPNKTLTFTGENQKTSATGVSKYFDIQNDSTAYYLLSNGVTISVNMPDMNGNTGFGFFDINGKAGANKIGVDVFPFSLGANIDKSNPLYDIAANKFNPYYAGGDIHTDADMCNITSDICTSDKIPSNPTAYVLRWDKLPQRI